MHVLAGWAAGAARAKFERYGTFAAGTLVAIAFAALLSIGYPGLGSASSQYAYGYGYEYQYTQPAHLNVVKHVVNDNGGGAVASNFTMTINGVAATGGNSFAGSESGTGRDVTSGSYNVTETGPAGYSASASSDCSGTIADGQTKTCTITNDDQPAHLVVIKHVVNDNGGSATASQFTMTINGVTATGGNSFPGAESPGTNKTVTPGSYTVTETGPAGYTASASADCAGSVALGQTKTCTITNDDQAAHLVVIKHVINNNSGSSSANQFTMTINGVTATGGNSFPGAESPGTNKTVTPGSYNVTETGPAGYVAFPSADCTGTIALGQTKTCTIVNNDIAPRLTQGYWKNHAPQTTALLPQKLGNYVVGTFALATAVFNASNCSSSKQNDAIGCLAAQLLAAELNLANASSPCIQPTVNKANTFLKAGNVTVSGMTTIGINYVGPSGTYTLTTKQRAVALALQAALARYNEGTSCTNP